jgi:poly(A) polymerase
LDVFAHNLAALKNMEKIIRAADRYFPENALVMQEYLAKQNMAGKLKWSALLHDIGKPATKKIRADKGGRITFYNHDIVGSRMVYKSSANWRWQRKDREFISFMIRMHMYPFHLCNAKREGKLGKKGRLKIIRRLGEHLPGVFLLAMADSLAGKGEQKPADMEQEVSLLFAELWQLYSQDVKPVVTANGLLSGQDLIDVFSLTPSPIFAKILNGLQLAQINKTVQTRDDALRWVESFIEKENEIDY